MERLAWYLGQFGKWLWRNLLPIVIAFVIVAVGAILAVVTRDLILTSAASAAWLTNLLTAAALFFVILALVHNLTQQAKSSLLETILTFAVGAFGAFTITSYWASDSQSMSQALVNFWNHDFRPLVPQLPEIASAAEAPDEVKRDAFDFADRSGDILNTALATLVTATVFVSAPEILRQLNKILRHLGFTKFQTTVAERVAMPIHLVVPKGRQLSELYPKSVSIDGTKLTRHNSSEHFGGSAALIKIYFGEANAPSAEPGFEWKDLAGALHQENVDLSRSVFLLVWREKETQPRIVAYGTGAELEKLINLSARSIGQRVMGMLSGRERPPSGPRLEFVPLLVSQARQELLKSHPHNDVLLSALVLDQSISIEKALQAMSYASPEEAKGAQRVLLTARAKSWPTAIVGGAEIAKFLSASE
jgi:hypothetical protein